MKKQETARVSFFSKNVLFFGILFIAIFFRFWQLALVPPSPSLDEVSIGYNAFSILHIGKDEYGNILPILLRAYDDWRPALYVYLVIPCIYLFGLSSIAIRIPSVILSIITVIASYFTTKLIFKKNNKAEFISLITMFLFAISPWHIYISRLGHEVNAGLTTVVLGIWFFFMAIREEKKICIIFSSIFFALSFYTYQSEKVFVPLLIISLLTIYKDHIIKIKKEAIIAFFLAVFITIPIIKVSLSPQGLIRLQATSAFSNLSSAYQISAIHELQDKRQGNIIGEFLDNRRFVPLYVFFSNYTSHFNPFWLYANLSQDSFKAPKFGLFYIWELPIFLIGIYFFFKTQDKKTKTFISLWFLISFVAPSITTQAPHAMRSYNLLPLPMMIEAIGAVTIIDIMKKTIKFQLIYILLFLVAMVYISQSVFYFYQQYFLAFPKEQSKPFQYALFHALQYVIEKKNNYSSVIISNQNNLYQSYMFYLFIKRYDPHVYLAKGGTKSGGFAQTHSIDNVVFRPIQWEKDTYLHHTLFVGNPSEIPSNAVIKSFMYLDGITGVVLAE
jgi:4-amino-4-deoxy-L-arabinose transferase-like glycosyltransferase